MYRKCAAQKLTLYVCHSFKFTANWLIISEHLYRIEYLFKTANNTNVQFQPIFKKKLWR